MREYKIMIYGAYGYTGTLIARRCKELGLHILVAGRDETALKPLALSTGFAYETINLDDESNLIASLSKAEVLIHCAGPFQHTSRKMVEACLKARTHYLDITGEYQVFEFLNEYDGRAKASSIMIMPGVGFDVVPSDCLALHLRNRLPGATHLQLAFAMSKGGLSRGTARTMIEGLGTGSMIRQNGILTKIDLGSRTKLIDFGSFNMNTLCIPWGDISTAFKSTRVPNIEVYTGVPEQAIRKAKLSRWISALLRMRVVKNFLIRQLNKRPAGPSEQGLKEGRSFLWGRATDSTGMVVESRLETLNGYALTAITSVLIANKVVHGNWSPGYYTPAMQYGESLILEVEQTSLTVVQ